MEMISEINFDMLLIDTRISRREGSLLELRREPIEDPLASADYELVMDPTRQAVIDMAHEFGYRVVVLKPVFTNEHGIDGYREGHRRAFLCAKKTGFEGLNVPVEK